MIERNEFGLRRKQIITLDDLVEFRNAAGDVLFTFDVTLKKLILPSTMSLEDENGAGTSGLIRSASVTLTDAQIKALPTTGIQIVAAPGAGKWIEGISAVILTNITAAYTNITDGSYFTATYGDATECFGFAPDDSQESGQVAFVTFLLAGTAAVRKTTLLPIMYGNSDSWGILPSYLQMATITNLPLNLFVSNDGGDFTGGNAANTMKVKVYYTIEDL